MAPRTIYHAMVYAVIAGASPHAACILRNLSSELSGRAFQFWIAIFYQARNLSGSYQVTFQLYFSYHPSYQVTIRLLFSYISVIIRAIRQLSGYFSFIFQLSGTLSGWLTGYISSEPLTNSNPGACGAINSSLLT